MNMVTDYNDSGQRKDLLIRFVIFFVICVLCITVPLYYLFNIPDKVLDQLNSSMFSEKKEQKKIDEIRAIIVELDGYVEENKYQKEYEYCVEKLFRYAKDSIDQSNHYKLYLLKVSDLYERIAKVYELSSKDELESLKKIVENKDDEISRLKKELEEITINYKVLQMSNKN